MMNCFRSLCSAIAVFGLFAGTAAAECSLNALDACAPDETARIERELRAGLDRDPDPVSLFALGRFYRTVAEPFRDYTQAIAYFEQASDAGEPWAMLALGEMLGKGEGTAADPERAEELLNEAAEAGLKGPALFALGNLRREAGAYDEAVTYFEQAVDAGEPWAMLALADMLDKGEGTAADPERAEELLNQALNKHHLNYAYVELIFNAVRNYTRPDAVQKTLGLLKTTHNVDPDLSKNAFKWLQPNQKAAVIQAILSIDSIYGGDLNGMLTHSTLSAIGTFCRRNGIDDCRREAMPPALLDALVTYLATQDLPA